MTPDVNEKAATNINEKNVLKIIEAQIRTVKQDPDFQLGEMFHDENGELKSATKVADLAATALSVTQCDIASCISGCATATITDPDTKLQLTYKYIAQSTHVCFSIIGTFKPVNVNYDGIKTAKSDISIGETSAKMVCNNCFAAVGTKMEQVTNCNIGTNLAVTCTSGFKTGGGITFNTDVTFVNSIFQGKESITPIVVSPDTAQFQIFNANGVNVFASPTLSAGHAGTGTFTGNGRITAKFSTEASYVLNMVITSLIQFSHIYTLYSLTSPFSLLPLPQPIIFTFSLHTCRQQIFLSIKNLILVSLCCRHCWIQLNSIQRMCLMLLLF